MHNNATIFSSGKSPKTKTRQKTVKSRWFAFKKEPFKTGLGNSQANKISSVKTRQKALRAVRLFVR